LGYRKHLTDVEGNTLPNSETLTPGETVVTIDSLNFKTTVPDAWSVSSSPRGQWGGRSDTGERCESGRESNWQRTCGQLGIRSNP